MSLSARQISDGPSELTRLQRENERLRKLLEEVAGSTFDGPMRAKINAELRKEQPHVSGEGT